MLDEYVERRSTLALGTVRTHRAQAELLKQTFGLLPPAKLTTDMLSDYRDTRAEQFLQHFTGQMARAKLGHKVTQTTINRELGLLRSALRDIDKRRPNLLSKVPYFPMESERGDARQGFLSEPDFREKLFAELPRHLQSLTACAFYGWAQEREAVH